eukprot:6088147-Heterocapsa_arctica.AAC.1
MAAEGMASGGGTSGATSTPTARTSRGGGIEQLVSPELPSRRSSWMSMARSGCWQRRASQDSGGPQRTTSSTRLAS